MFLGRGNKERKCIWFAAWHCQLRGPHWLFDPPCFWQQEHASALFLPLVHAVLFPAPCFSSQSIADPQSFPLGSGHFLISPFTHHILPMDDGCFPSGGAVSLLRLLSCHKHGEIQIEMDKEKMCDCYPKINKAICISPSPHHFQHKWFLKNL